jgi:hypothetical protein
VTLLARIVRSSFQLVADWLRGPAVSNFSDHFVETPETRHNEKIERIEKIIADPSTAYIVEFAIRHGERVWWPCPNASRRRAGGSQPATRIYLSSEEALNFALKAAEHDRTYEYRVSVCPLPESTIPGRKCRYCGNPATGEVMVYSPIVWGEAPKSEDFILVGVCGFCREGTRVCLCPTLSLPVDTRIQGSATIAEALGKLTAPSVRGA